MRIVVSVATSLDGFISDDGPHRLVLSSPEDLEEVHRLRAQSDAILVGGETVRRDDPSLATRLPAGFELRRQRGVAPHPIKATITRSGDLPPESKFFTEGDAPKLVYCEASVAAGLERRLGSRASVIPLQEGAHVAQTIVADLARRGVGQLMIEGGARTIGLFLDAGLVDAVRLAVAPVVCGERGRSRPFSRPFPQWADRGRITLREVRALGDTVVAWYELERMHDAAG